MLTLKSFTQPAPAARLRKARAHAFTLIETLVVISIICLIIALIWPALLGARERASFTRWQAYSQSAQSDPDMLTYYTLQSSQVGQPVTLQNLAIGDPMNPASNPQQYSVVAPPTVALTEGRWPGKFALLFDPSLNGDAVILPMADELADASAFSVVTWVRIDGAPAGGFAYLVNQWWWDASDDRSWSLNLSGDYLELRMSPTGVSSNLGSNLRSGSLMAGFNGRGSDNTGTGNNGNGVGNTGPGNQGNDTTNGNAGGGGSNNGGSNSGNGGSNTGTGNNGNGNGNTGPGNQGNTGSNGNAGGGGSNNGGGSGGIDNSGVVIRVRIDEYYSQWIQIAATWDGKVVSLYINGEIVGSATVPGLYRSSRPVMIGAGNSGTAYPFKGAIDEVAILTRALTADEIKQNHEMGQP